MTSNRRRGNLMRTALTFVAAICAAGLLGCRTTGPDIGALDLESARSDLMRPLSGDPSVLYRLRVPSSGGLRMSVLTSGDAGRLTVSEPFGSAVSVTAWQGDAPPVFYDLRQGCRLEAADLSQVLGIGAMPLPQAVALLGGRMPALADDAVSTAEGAHFLVEGHGWAAQVEVAPDPWRVIRVHEAGRSASGWRLVLGDHTGSVPGSVRLKNGGGRWAELELVRLEWHRGGDLPDLPDVPPCVLEGRP